MQTSNANQNLESNDSVWYFLAKYSLSELMSYHKKRDELAAGLLFQSLQELGIPPECVENIRMTLTRFAKEAWVQFEQGRVELPGQIRVFCQNKVIGDANTAKHSRPCSAERAVEYAPTIHPTGTAVNGGWGYFLIERGRDFSAGSSGSSPNLIDLYLYKEGE